MVSGKAGPAPRPDAREICVFVEAMAALLAASLAVAVLPFRWLTRTIAGPRLTARTEPARATADVVKTIGRAERRLPLRIVCLHEALAAHWMLRRRGIISFVHYGIRPDDAALKAHVWVEVEGRIVIGSEERETFARVATFPETSESAVGD